MERVLLSAFVLHVDELFCVGDKELYQHVVSSIQRDYHTGSDYTNDVLFVGQGVRWKTENNRSVIQVDQERAIEELGDIEFDKSFSDAHLCVSVLHTQYRSVLGQVNWLHSRTQYNACYRFSRCASAAASPHYCCCKTVEQTCQVDKI